MHGCSPCRGGSTSGLPSQCKCHSLHKAPPKNWLQRGPSPLPPPSHSHMQNSYFLIRSCHNLPSCSILTHVLFAITPAICISLLVEGRDLCNLSAHGCFPWDCSTVSGTQGTLHQHMLNEWIQSVQAALLAYDFSQAQILCASVPLSIKMGL